MGDQPADGRDGRGGGFAGWRESMEGMLPPREARLLQLMEEFFRRQRRCPNLVVRPWWTAPGGDGVPMRVGFVVEYCPRGRESVELVVRSARVTVDGRLDALEAELDLDDGWALGGTETGSPETLANHILRLADRALEEAA